MDLNFKIKIPIGDPKNESERQKAFDKIEEKINQITNKTPHVLEKFLISTNSKLKNININTFLNKYSGLISFMFLRGLLDNTNPKGRVTVTKTNQGLVLDSVINTKLDDKAIEDLKATVLNRTDKIVDNLNTNRFAKRLSKIWEEIMNTEEE